VPAHATNYFYGPGTNYWFGANVLGTAQVGIQDPDSPAFTNGNLFFTGTIGGAGALHAASGAGLGSTLIWYNSTLNGPAVSIDGLSQILLEDRFSHELAAASLNNSGNFVWTNGSKLLIDGGTVFNNLPGGNVYAFLSNAGVDATVQGSGVVNNSGTLFKSVGTNGLLFASSGPAFNNTGTLDIQSGYVQLAGGTNSGTFDLFGGELWLGYNNCYLESGAQFLGTNFVRAVGPGSVFVDASVAMANFILQNATATLDGPGSLTVSNICNLANGTLQGTGTVTIPAGAQLNASGSVNWVQRTVNNSGNAAITGQLVTQGDGAFNNLPGGVFALRTDNGIGFGSGVLPAFNNSGIFKKSSGTGQSPMAPRFTNSATVQIQSGTVSFYGGYRQNGGSTTTASGTILQSSVNGVTLNGGTLSGLGSVSGPVTNSATILPGPLGTLIVQGNYAQTPAAALGITLGGAAPGQFSRLSVNSLVTVAGTLDVTLTNGFLHAVGNTFGVVSAGATPSGHFGSFVSHAPNGVALVPQYAALGINLVGADDLVISGPLASGNQFSFHYPSTSGLTNIVEYTTSLTPVIHWQVLTNIPGDGSL
jgi:hypothetical protein